jgi:hypothetical protein
MLQLTAKLLALTTEAANFQLFPRLITKDSGERVTDRATGTGLEI